MLLRHVVAPRRAAVNYVNGELRGVLSAGRHWRRPGQRLVVVDLREQLLQLALQEVPTSDGITVRVSATVRYAVVDPVAFVEVSSDPLAVVYLAAQLALREAVSTVDAQRLVARDAQLPTAQLVERVGSAVGSVGIEVSAVVLRDILLPAELRSATMDLLTARNKAAVQLEQARADAAALRSLANSAKLLDDHPALAQLRMIQAAPYGAKVVIRIDEP